MKVLDFGLARAMGRHRQRPPDCEFTDGHRGWHAGRRAARDRAVHEPRAGARTDGRQAHRYLGVRLCALRDADRRAGVRGRRRRRGARQRDQDGARLDGCSRRTHPRRCGCACSVVCRRISGSGSTISPTCASRWRAPSSNRPATATRVNAADRLTRDSPTPAGRSRSLAIAAAFAIVAFAPGPPAEVPETRLEIVTPPAADPLSLAISPDGRSVVFQAGQDPPRLWLRPLDSQEARPLAGTDGAVLSVLVAGQPVGRVHRGWRVEADRSRQRPRAHAGQRSSAGGTWSVDGTILIGSVIGPLYSVPADGGAVKAGYQSAARTEQSSLAAVSARWPAVPALHAGTQRRPRCVSRDPWPTRPCNEYRIENPATGSCRPLTCCSPGKARCGHGASAAISRRSRASWCRLPRRFWSTRGFFGYSAFSSSSTGSIAYRASAGETQLVWLDRTGRLSAP